MDGIRAHRRRDHSAPGTRGPRRRGRRRAGSAGAHRRGLRQGLPYLPRLRRPRGRDRDGQVRPCRRQDRRHPGQHRHAGLLRASGRGQSRRPGHDHRHRRGAGHFQFRRDAGDPHYPAAHQAARRAPHRHDRPAGLDPGRGCRRAPGHRRGQGGLSAQPGAHGQHHGHAGHGRRPGGGAAEQPRLHARGFRLLPSRRPAGPAPAAACA